MASGTSCEWVAGTYSYLSITVENSASIFVNSTLGYVIVYTQDLDISIGGNISAQGSGYAPESGPGKYAVMIVKMHLQS